uniref:Cadherin domain-containing protein n=1 Tax=Helobdella robusta TaxID=6412 RepID=T1EHV4_HELRO
MVLKQKLDREFQDRFELFARVIDKDLSNSSSTLQIHIKVLDANDNNPVFEKSFYIFDLFMPRESKITLGSVKATDMDLGKNGQVVYQIVSINKYHAQFMTVDKTSGLLELFVTDWCKFPSSHVRLNVSATDGGMEPLQDLAIVNINITKFNCYEPEIKIGDTSVKGVIKISPGIEANGFISFINVYDEDGDDVSCSVDSKYLNLLSVYKNIFKLILMIDAVNIYEDEIFFNILCFDNGKPSMNASKNFTIVFDSQNYNAPVFLSEDYNFYVQENNDTPVFIGSVRALDIDRGKNGEIEYFLLNENNILSVGKDSGDLFLLKSLDYEVNQLFEFLVIACDRGEPNLTSNVSVFVNVVNTNDRAPMFDRQISKMSVYENSPKHTFVGHLSIHNDDLKPFDEVFFVVDNESSTLFNKHFYLDNVTRSITTKLMIDRETISSFVFKISVYDAHTNVSISSTELFITILDVNDNVPIILKPDSTSAVLEISKFLPPASMVTQIVAVDHDSSMNGQILYLLNHTSKYSSMFSLNNQTGELYL